MEGNFTSYEINYADYFEITEAPAIAICIIYGIFFFICATYAILYRSESIKAVFPLLTFFSTMRTIAFGLRAGVAADGTDLNLYIASQVFLAAGFFALVNVSYTLIKIWYAQAKEYYTPQSQHRVAFLYRASHFCLLAAVACGVAGGSMSVPTASESQQNLASHLTTASRWLYFAAVVVFFMLASVGLQRVKFASNGDKTTELQIDVGILLVVAAFLMVRVCYSVSSIDKLIGIEEKYFYPLSVLPELLVLIIYIIPGVVKRFNYTSPSAV